MREPIGETPPERTRARQESSVIRTASRHPQGADHYTEDRDDATETAEPLLRAAILIVDDVTANLVSLEAVLEPLGHRIVRATSGEDALKRLLTEDFAVVLLDVQMPGLDGFETAALIKTHPRLRATPIIFVTAISRDASHVFRGYEHGAVDYLLKPFDPDILRSKVRVFVDLYLRGERLKNQAAIIRMRDLELAERRGRDRYLNLMEAMPNALWATTEDGTVHYANRAWREYSGFTSGELVGFTDRRVVHELDRPHVATAWLMALQESSSFEVECRLHRSADGAYRWHLLRATPERRERGVAHGWIVSATDIHEGKCIEEMRVELLRREQLARREAEDANRSKDDFLATVSHELRAPLHAILGWVKMLRTEPVDAPQTERALRTIERNAEVQAALVDDLLNVSRVVAGKFDIKVRTTDLASIARAVSDALTPHAESKEVRLALALDDGADDRITADPQRLQQVLWNLASNAVKFTPPGGRVGIRVAADSDQCAIEVTDDGVGMSPEFLGVAFDRFTQADGSIRRSYGGLGLGLFIARHLVELHGGTLTASSRGIGCGSRFVASFPRLAEPSTHGDELDPLARGERLAASGTTSPLTVPPGRPRASSPPSPRPPASLQDVTVLVVDDDKDARELVVMMLERVGATAIACSSAQHAVDAVTARRPDVLISDIGLPGEDGYAMLGRIRALGPDGGGLVPAIAVSGYARPNDRSRALSSGFQAHLAKPLELSELLALVARIAGRTESTAERGAR